MAEAIEVISIDGIPILKATVDILLASTMESIIRTATIRREQEVHDYGMAIFIEAFALGAQMKATEIREEEEALNG